MNDDNKGDTNQQDWVNDPNDLTDQQESEDLMDEY